MQCLLFAIALLQVPIQADSLRFRNVGPGGGGWIQSLALDPVNPQVIHVGCDVGGYYQSRDGGRTFHIQNSGLTDYFVQRIVVDPRNSQVLYLGTESGVFKSLDGGQTWTAKRVGFPPLNEYRHSAPIGSLVMDPTDSRTLYAGLGKPRQMTDGCGRIYKTTDGGESWQALDSLAKLAPDAVIHQLALVPRRPSTLFAATQHGLFKSVDGGQQWQRMSTGLPHGFCRNVAIHPGHPETMYVVLWSQPGKQPWQGGVYRSDDGGETWTARNDGLPQDVAPPGDAPQKTCNYVRLALDPRDPDRLFVGANSWWGAGLYRSTDGGRHWSLCTRRGDNANVDVGWIDFWGLAVKCLAVSTLDPQVILFGDSGRVLRSDDGGDSWRQLYMRSATADTWQGNGLEVTCLHQVTADPHHAGKLFCGYADIGLMVSEDGGSSWRRGSAGLPSHGDVARVVCDPDRPGVAWCCEGKGKSGKGCIAQTTDGGASWQVVASEKTGLPPGATSCLLLDPHSSSDARTLYVAVGSHGLFRSSDGGRTWCAVNRGLGTPPFVLTDLVFTLDQPPRLLASRGADAEGERGGLFVSNDSGAHWQRLNQTPELPNIRDVECWPHDPQTLFVACRQHYDHQRKQQFAGGIYRSHDGGETWEHVFADRFASCVRADPRDPRRLYAGTTRHPYHDNPVAPGLLVSRDGGDTWAPCNDGLSSTHVGVIAPDPHEPDRVYVGTDGNGLFVGEWK